MGKENYTRYSMRENMLKKVLVRIDYDGVTDINRWIEVIKADDLVRTRFQSYHQTMLNNATFDLSKMDEIAEQRSIPISAFKSQPVHRFSQATFAGHDDAISMEIANLFTTFLIDCRHYTTIDDYFVFLSDYFQRFLSFDPYIKIMRIGIRKIGGDTFTEIDQIGKVFEGNFFNKHAVDEAAGMIEREYHDRFFKSISARDGENDGHSLKVNFSTFCRRIEDAKPFQALLDIDGYVDSFVIKRDKLQFPQDFNSTLTVINEYLFELYKKSVTIEYLAAYGEERQ